MRSIHGTPRQTRGFLLIQKARNDLFRARFHGCGDHAMKITSSIEITVFPVHIHYRMSNPCPINYELSPRKCQYPYVPVFRI